MAQEMSFAQALNEAKGVILQLSNRVKADAEKIRMQQQTIVSLSATVTQSEVRARQQAETSARQAEELAALRERAKQADAAREHAEAILNRQGQKITHLESANAELTARMSEHKAQIVALSQQRDALRAQLPSDEDAAALASMAQLLHKAAPAIEKAKKTTAAVPGKMRLAGNDSIAEAA
jgi:chromosome segregation ATPase